VYSACMRGSSSLLRYSIAVTGVKVGWASTLSLSSGQFPDSSGSLSGSSFTTKFGDGDGGVGGRTEKLVIMGDFQIRSVSRQRHWRGLTRLTEPPIRRALKAFDRLVPGEVVLGKRQPVFLLTGVCMTVSASP
jgi:hypothetical protein